MVKSRLVGCSIGLILVLGEIVGESDSGAWMVLVLG
jgi:hypothetical protein